MRIQLLRTFLACAELRSISLAAGELLYSESSVASHIRDLEKALGAQLFTRRDGRLELTTAGEAVLSPAARLLRTADEMARSIRECARDGRRGRVPRPAPGIANAAGTSLPRPRQVATTQPLRHVPARRREESR